MLKACRPTDARFDGKLIQLTDLARRTRTGRRIRLLASTRAGPSTGSSAGSSAGWAITCPEGLISQPDTFSLSEGYYFVSGLVVGVPSGDPFSFIPAGGLMFCPCCC